MTTGPFPLLEVAGIYTEVGETEIQILGGDLTLQETEAIVNAANSPLMGGGGVDGAVHQAGGPQILQECRAIVARQGSLPVGQAVLTSGGRLRARYVIHTVGPIWRGGKQGEHKLLAQCYLNCLAVAVDHGIKSLSFPSISTGAYGFPIREAAPIALRAVLAGLPGSGLTEVRFVLFSEEDLRVYEEVWRELGFAG